MPPTFDGVIFMPTEHGTAPAPFMLTEEELARLVRLECDDVSQALKRYRAQGVLRGTQVGRHIRYMLTDALKFVEHLRERNPR